ncbi:MAG TPA: hypothetical protein VLK84_12850 [Longimicrobium sp.]|nr:hypothetical protein [Longimicrobium sp.]
MPSETVSELIELAGALRPAHQDLLERARALGRSLGIEVLDLRPAGAGGAWDVRVRALAEPEGGGAEMESTAGAPAAADLEPQLATGTMRPPPFLSPVRESAPFAGDGSDDILRFIAEADPRTRVPPRGGPSPGASIRVLSAAERVRMLASTIAGDALLSLQHRGLATDEAEVKGALVHAREQYLAEVGRAGADAHLTDPGAFFDRVAADLCHNLLNGC